MKDKDFQQLVDREFAQLEWTDQQRMNTLRQMNKEDKPVMKRKFSVAIIATLLLLALSTTAVAAGVGISTINDFMNRLRGEGYSSPLVNEAAVVTPIRQRHTSELLDIWAEQIYLTDQAFYFTLHFTPKDDKTLLFPCGANSTMLDGQEVRYFDLWDTDLTLLQLGPFELDNLVDRNAIIPMDMPQFYQEPETNEVTLLCSTHDLETVKRLNSVGSTSLMLRFYIDDCRTRSREWNVLFIDAPHIDRQSHGDALN